MVVLAVVVLNALIGFARSTAPAGRSRRWPSSWPSRRACAATARGRGPRRAGRSGRRGRSPKATGSSRILRMLRARAARGRGGADRRVGAGGQGPRGAGRRAARRAPRCLHAGTVVAAGTGAASPSRPATATELGRISGLLGTVEPLQTPLTRRARARARSPRPSAPSRWCSGRRRLRGFPLADAALAAISLAVAAVPEGLPGRRDDRARDRRAADGARQRDRPPPAGRRDAGQHDRGRLRQDRHADPQRDSCRPSGRRPEASLGTAGRRAPTSRRAAARRRALQRRAVAAGRRLGDPTETALLDAAERAGIDVAAERAARPRWRRSRSTPSAA